MKNPREVTEAIVKARILTGTYTLQANKHRFNQFEIEPTCLLCGSAPENRSHFLLHCPSLNHVRSRILDGIVDIFSPDASGVAGNCEADDCSKVQAIIDCGHSSFQELSKEDSRRVEKLSRSLVYNLHICRTKILAEIA